MTLTIGRVAKGAVVGVQTIRYYDHRSQSGGGAPEIAVTGRDSEIFRAKARALRDACKHARPDFFTIMEGEHDVRPI